MDYTTKLSNNTNPSFSMARKEKQQRMAQDFEEIKQDFTANAKQATREVFDTKIISKEFDDITNSYYKQGYEDAVSKACEWIHSALYLDYERSIEHRYATLEELLNDFRKAMKGE